MAGAGPVRVGHEDLRRFVLEPLAEIAPDALHPILKRSARAMLAALSP